MSTTTRDDRPDEAWKREQRDIAKADLRHAREQDHAQEVAERLARDRAAGMRELAINEHGGSRTARRETRSARSDQDRSRKAGRTRDNGRDFGIGD